MRKLSNIPNTDPVDSDYPKGRIRNKDTVADPPEEGTPVIEELYGDMIQLFQKLVDLAGITENLQPDNTTNGYQLLEAFEYWIRTLTASETQKGVVEKATTAETEAGTIDKYIDAEKLQALTATETRKGIVEKATTAEAQGGTAEKYLDAALLQDVTATETRKGIVEKATTAETEAGTADKYIDAEKLQALTATTSRAGIQENATDAEALALTNAEKTITPYTLGEVTDGFKIVDLDIGDWDMDGTFSTQVSHPFLDASKFRIISITIRDDNGVNYTLLDKPLDNADTTPQGGCTLITDNSIYLVSLNSGYYKTSFYNQTGGYNRGWITCLVKP